MDGGRRVLPVAADSASYRPAPGVRPWQGQQVALAVRTIRLTVERYGYIRTHATDPMPLYQTASRRPQRFPLLRRGAGRYRPQGGAVFPAAAPAAPGPAEHFRTRRSHGTRPQHPRSQPAGAGRRRPAAPDRRRGPAQPPGRADACRAGCPGTRNAGLGKTRSGVSPGALARRSGALAALLVELERLD